MTRKDKEELLINVYNQGEEVKKLSDEDLDKLLEKEQKQAVANKKNPNWFFILKDLPSPKEFKTKTSKKGGIIIFSALIGVMLIFGALMFWWAFK